MAGFFNDIHQSWDWQTTLDWNEAFIWQDVVACTALAVAVIAFVATAIIAICCWPITLSGFYVGLLNGNIGLMFSLTAPFSLTDWLILANLTVGCAVEGAAVGLVTGVLIEIVHGLDYLITSTVNYMSLGAV